MGSCGVRRLRSDGIKVRVCSPGPTVFLYDRASAGRIRAARPSLLVGDQANHGRVVDVALRAFGRGGLLVVLEPHDRELRAEVSLGPPLFDGETGNLPWSAPRSARLLLPSGTLCIESLVGLRGAPGEPSEMGCEIRVPPGDYLVSMQCLPPDYEQDPESLVPEYYLSLQPRVASATMPVNQPLLTHSPG